jgi:23S rRNA pseudouridine1911/1915/1917 synthase
MVGRAESQAEGMLPEGADGAAEGDDEAPERRQADVASEQHGERLDKALVLVAPEFSRSYLQGLIRGGQVRIDEVVVASPAQRVRAGQRLSVTLLPTAESRAYRAEALPLVVVHEDEDLLVVDKAAGMVVHPAAGNWSGTLLNALLARYPASAVLPRAGIVHRLDKDTSGLMVVGKTLAAVTGLVRAIAAREVHRRYLAIAHGRPRLASFTIDAPLGRDPLLRTRMAIVASGKASRTDVECLASAHGVSALRCTLHTGRTHQIRVHLASLGLPLVGDRVYGGRPALGVERQALHAAELKFAHPVAGRAIELSAPLPQDLAGAWQDIQQAAAAVPVPGSLQ